jgi:hypothetical protein
MTLKRIAFVTGIWLASIAAAFAQGTVPGQRVIPLGYCQIATLTTAVLVTPASCVGASFTATGSSTNLTTSAVTGYIKPGAAVTGTGVPAGTYIVSQTSGTAGGAGVYVTSAATTSSGASLTSGGIPRGATSVLMNPESQIVRFRDDGGTPTASVGQPIAATGTMFYTGTLSALNFIEATAGAKLNLTFFK